MLSVPSLIMRLPPGTRVVPVMLGAVLIHLSLGTYHTFGNMLPYMASFMRNRTDPNINLQELVWIPTLQGCFPFAMVLGGVLSQLLGPRMASFIGCSLMTGGVYLSSITIRVSLAAFVFTYGFMYGLGQGIAYVVAVSAVINWAPDRVGLVSGIVAAGFGVSSSIFAPIQTGLVNPWNYPPGKDLYFHEKVLLDRVPTVFKTLSIVYATMQCIGLIFICDPPNMTKRRRRSRVSSEEEEAIEESEDSDEEEEEGIRSMTPREVLSSTTFYFLFAALFCCSFYANMFYNLYKTFAETFIDDDMFLAVAFSVGSVANALARIGWGHLTDRTSFQVSLSSACCGASALLLTMPVTALFGPFVFVFWLVLLFICMAATHALFITAAVRCFGAAHKATNYGLLILSTTMSGILLSFVAQYWLDSIGYNWMFLLTAIFPFVAFLITSVVHTTPQGHRISS